MNYSQKLQATCTTQKIGVAKKFSNLILKGRLLPLMKGADDTQLVVMRDIITHELSRRDRKAKKLYGKQKES